MKSTAHPAAADRHGRVFTAIAITAFAGSALLFMVGMVVSLATAWGLCSGSATVAHFTILALLVAFALAFAGAHAVDKLESIRE